MVAAVRSSAAITPAMLGGMAVALILLALPVGMVETIVASSGLSEAWPAAAPPLGLKARLLLAGFGALMGMGFVCSSGINGASPMPMKEDGRRKGVPGVSEMGFALSKLNWLSRSRATGSSRMTRPAPRRADAHPDAPARAPIFASRDFGGLEIFPRIAPARVEQAERSATGMLVGAQDFGPEPIEAAFEEITAVAADQPCSDDAVAHASAAVQAPSIAELTARLERGLAQRVRGTRTAPAGAVIADMPVEQAVPVRKQVEDDVDQALRTALGTLRAMAERTR